MGASVLALVAAAIVAAGFAALANLVLNRRPASLAEWNESFLAGLGMVAAIAIPLSLLGWPSLRFAILIGLLLVVVLRRSDFTASRPRTPSGTLGARIAATMAVAPGVVLFAVANARSSYGWDGFQIWMTKAQEFYWTGSLRLAVPTPEYMERVVAYPPAVPVYEALVGTFYRSFPMEGVKAVFTIFAVSLAVGTFHLVAGLTDRRTAAIAAGLTGLLPGLTMGAAIGGYADMPLAAVAAAAAAASLRTRYDTLTGRSPAPWLLGALTTVKSEGTILLGVGLGIVGLWALARRTRLSPRAASSLIPLVFLAAARIVHRKFIPGTSREFAPVLSLRAETILARVPWIVGGMLHWLLNFRMWGLLWPAFAVAFLIVARTAPRSSAMPIATAALLSVLADGSLFLYTNWGNGRLHLDQAFPRLIAQVAPLAAATIAAAAFALRPRPATR